MSTEQETRHPIEEIAEDFATRYRRGERPPLSEYTQKFPEWADDIRDLFPALVIMEDASKTMSSETATEEAGEPIGFSLPKRLGEFRLVREIGRGGMGVVLEAVQEPLGRSVALKVLPSHVLRDDVQRERFLREARAAANLHHSNIVPVFAVGEQDGLPYYAMQYIQGRSLSEIIEGLQRSRSDDSNISVAHIGLQAAEALACAHQHGILHRDVKPPNLLLDTDGVVWITDFGLAKTASPAVSASLGRKAGEDLTQTGDVVGTLRYLAPERFRGAADARSDIYSLGLTLYELATLRPVFSEADRQQLLQQVMEANVTPPRRIDSRIPRDFETILMKCMARDPNRRYQTARELAEDLRRHLNGEPIRARRITPLERGLLWTRRHPAAAGLLAVSGIAIVSVAAFLVYFSLNRQLVSLNTKLQSEKKKLASAVDLEAKARKNEKKARLRAEELKQIAQRGRYNNATLLAHREWKQGNVQVARRLHASVPPAFRKWEWHYLQRVIHQESAEIRGDNMISFITMNRDGTRVAWSEVGQRLRVADVRTGKILFTLEEKGGSPATCGLSPDGALLVACPLRRKGRPSITKIWDVATGKVARILPRSGSLFIFNSNGSQLALGSSIWDVKSGKLLFELQDLRSPLRCVVFGNSGEWIAGSTRKEVFLWDGKTGKLVHIVGSHPVDIYSLAFLSDGALMSASRKEVRIWNCKKAKLVRAVSCAGGDFGNRLTLRPSGSSPRRLLAAMHHNTVILWNTFTGKKAHTFRGEPQMFSSLAFSGDGKRLTTGSVTKIVRVFNVDRTPNSLVIQNGRTRLQPQLAFHPSGDWLAAAAANAQIRVFALPTGKELKTIQLPGIPGDIVYCPDGELLAYACHMLGNNRKTEVYLRKAKGQLADSFAIAGIVGRLAFDPQGKLLAFVTGKSVRFRDIASKTELPSLVASRYVRDIAFAPNGKLLAVAYAENVVRMWDVEQNKFLYDLHGHTGSVNGLAFHRDGKRLATCGRDGQVKLWDLRQRKVIFDLVGHSYDVKRVAFHPTEERLISAGHDATLNMWDIETGQLVLSLRDPNEDGDIKGLAISANGRYVATSNERGVLHVFNKQE